MADFTLPGAIPKLPRRCSPIVVTGGQYAGRHGIIVEDPKGCANVLVCLDDDGNGTTLAVLALSDIALDLSVSTGLIHAYWWLVAQTPSIVLDAVPALGVERTFTDDFLDRILADTALASFHLADFYRVCVYVAEKVHA